jgi:DNA repair exonuclease SbcCD ATPase subunit
MYGVHEAQLSIVSEILERKTCICGPSIGPTGMGRERLKHVMETLEEKKKGVSDWDRECIWCSDQMVTKASMELSQKGPSGSNIHEILKEVENLRKSVDESPLLEDERARLVEAVRSHERSRILLQGERTRLGEYEKECEQIDAKIRELETEMIVLVGSREERSDLEMRLSGIEKALVRSREIIENRMEEVRSDLEKVSTDILRRITGRVDIRVMIHPGDMRIGRRNGSEKRVLPLGRLSAGERESLILSIIIAFSNLTGSGMILDSPFAGMESDSIKGFLDMLSVIPNNILVLTPSGTVKDIPLSARRLIFMKGEKGSIIKEVSS